jgi:hypothetical protein
MFNLQVCVMDESNCSSVTSWLLCGFRLSWKIIKARLAVCVIIFKSPLGNAALKGARHRFKSLRS